MRFAYENGDQLLGLLENPNDNRIKDTDFGSYTQEKFEKDFGDIDAETLAGLFINKLGLLPKVGDKIDIDNMILSITAADKRKVKKIGITIKTNR